MRRSELLCLLRDTGPLAGAHAQVAKLHRQEKQDHIRLNLRVPFQLLLSLDDLAVKARETFVRLKFHEPVKPETRRQSPAARPIPEVSIRGCQWLFGEGKERNFCGATLKPGSSYCAEHHARCHEKHAGFKSVR
jgi:GcrA cell cycle regulator